MNLKIKIILSFLILITLYNVNISTIKAENLASVSVDNYEYQYQSNGSILNSGTITLVLAIKDETEFPGNGIVYLVNTEGRTISSSGTNWKKQDDGTWKWIMYIPSNYYKIYMDNASLTIPVEWVGFGSWKVLEEGNGIVLNEKQVNPKYSISDYTASPSLIKKHVNVSYKVLIDPTWPVYKGSNLRVEMSNPTCEMVTVTLTEGISNSYQYNIDYGFKEVKPAQPLLGEWKLIYKSVYGEDIEWAHGNTMMPKCY